MSINNKGKVAYRKGKGATVTCSLCTRSNTRTKRVCWWCRASLRNRPKPKRTTTDQKRQKQAATYAAKHLATVKRSLTLYQKWAKRERYYALKIAKAQHVKPGTLRALNLEGE